MEIAIIGGGIAGLTTALALKSMEFQPQFMSVQIN